MDKKRVCDSMIVDGASGRRVRVRYRDPITLERKEDVINEYYPYFYVKDEDVHKIPPQIAVLKKESGHSGVYGENLTKITVRNPYDMRGVKYAKIPTWEANIPWTNKALVERLENNKPEYEYYDHRIWYLDAEWKSESEEMTIITVKDSYTDKTYTWFHHPDYKAGNYDEIPCINHPTGAKEYKFTTTAKCFANEKDMLIHFVNHLRSQDPDIIAGWFLVSADIQVLAKRLQYNGIDPATLSPHKKHVFKYNWTDKQWVQPIPGRICLDLMVCFSKLWTIKNGQLPGQGLDAVSKHCLGERKVELPDGHDTYYTDVGTYIDYNIQDVMLLPKLDGMINCIDFYMSMQHFCQCDFETVAKTTGLATSLFLRDSEFTDRIPTDPQFQKVDYAGADIQEPNAGLYGPTAILDIRAMYHSNVNLHNICWTTLDENGKDCGNGISFSQDNKGLLGRTMDYLTTKRNEYKQKLKEAKDKDEKRKWDSMQFATKSLVASLYGVSGDSRYGLYNPKIAAAITFTSRQTLFKLRDECKVRGHDVIYGHTDSIFCLVESAEQGVELNKELNKAMSPIIVEFEKFAESIMLKAKNRYAGKITWADGEYLSEPDYYVKGIEVIQARMPPAMKKTIMRVLKGMLDGESKDSLEDDIFTRIEAYVAGDSWEDLLMQGKLKKNLWEYKVLSGPTAGAEWALYNLDHEFSVGDSFLVALTKNGKYVAFPNLEWLPKVKDKVDIGYKVMTKKFIVDKAQDLYEVVGWDYQGLHNALEGHAKVAWL